MTDVMTRRQTLAVAAAAGYLASGLALSVSARAAGEAAGAEQKPHLTPEQKMARRFPQPVRTGDLVGLPVLDFNDSTIGYIARVVRTPDGKIQLIVPYATWFGWVKLGGALDGFRRPVAVPLETVAILAKQVNALDFARADFDVAPTWSESSAAVVPADEVIRIAIGRR